MTFYYAISGTERSIFQVNSPSADSIRQALSRIQFECSHWVGPSPRITRTTEFSLHGVYVTRFTWVLAVDCPLSPEAVPAQAQREAGYINGALSSLTSGWDPVSVTPYSEAVNGPLSFWDSGQASVTKSQDTALGATDAFTPNDNPLGPDNPNARPSTLGEGAQNASSNLGSAVNAFSSLSTDVISSGRNIAILAVVGVVVIAGVVYLPQAAAARAARKPRRNPFTARTLR